jgi:hypothetical protein
MKLTHTDILVTDIRPPGLYSGIGLPIWTLYDHPHDFPEHYVLRLFDGMSGQASPVIFLANTLDDIHRAMAVGYICICREEGDDPKIICSYV